MAQRGAARRTASRRAATWDDVPRHSGRVTAKITVANTFAIAPAITLANSKSGFAIAIADAFAISLANAFAIANAYAIALARPAGPHCPPCPPHLP